MKHIYPISLFYWPIYIFITIIIIIIIIIAIINFCTPIRPTLIPSNKRLLTTILRVRNRKTNYHHVSLNMLGERDSLRQFCDKRSKLPSTTMTVLNSKRLIRIKTAGCCSSICLPDFVYFLYAMLSDFFSSGFIFCVAL